MKNNKLFILAGLTALVLAALACGGSFSTANIADAWMSTDTEGNNRTTVFAQDAVFYAQVDLQNAPDDTALKAVWTAISAEGTDPNFVINETEFVSGSGVVYFELSNTNLWPVGTYKVDIYMNDALTKTVNFEVR
jgi:hypothetical protein